MTKTDPSPVKTLLTDIIECFLPHHGRLRTITAVDCAAEQIVRFLEAENWFLILLCLLCRADMQNYWACKFIFADLCIHQLICLIVDIYVSKICFYLHGVVVDIFCFVDILYFNMSVGLGPGLTSALKLRRDMTVRKLASYREGTLLRKYFSTYLLVLWFGLDRCLWEWSVNAVQGQEDGQLL